MGGWRVATSRATPTMAYPFPTAPILPSSRASESRLGWADGRAGGCSRAPKNSPGRHTRGQGWGRRGKGWAGWLRHPRLSLKIWPRIGRGFLANFSQFSQSSANLAKDYLGRKGQGNSPRRRSRSLGTTSRGQRREGWPGDCLWAGVAWHMFHVTPPPLLPPSPLHIAPCHCIHDGRRRGVCFRQPGFTLPPSYRSPQQQRHPQQAAQGLLSLSKNRVAPLVLPPPHTHTSPSLFLPQRPRWAAPGRPLLWFWHARAARGQRGRAQRG